MVLTYRHDFDVRFDRKTTTSVFQLLQQACFQMAKTSYDSKQNASQDQQRLVYTHFMWGEYELNAYHCSLQEFVVMLFLTELAECGLLHK